MLETIPESQTGTCGRVATVRASIAHSDADAVFARIVDFGAYPEVCPDVVSVSVGSAPVDGSMESTWEVRFRGGTMIWTERDAVDSARRVCEFVQTSGDLEVFSGTWHVQSTDAGRVAISFECVFDIGVPSLADMLNPVAGRAITDNIRSMIDGLFGGCDVREL
ncbi:aromatase/cyclase [Tsukamurella serpentis]